MQVKAADEDVVVENQVEEDVTAANEVSTGLESLGDAGGSSAVPVSNNVFGGASTTLPEIAEEETGLEALGA